MTNGFIFYEGPSLIDGCPIVGIATGHVTNSTNTKTGAVIQTHILRQDIHPIESVNTKEDYSICGMCPLRKEMCYVNLLPEANIWKKYKKGDYPYISNQDLTLISSRRKTLRLGTYGDPVYIPFSYWEPLLESSWGAVGYTHAWQWEFVDPIWKSYLMASVQQESQIYEANQLGWRTFRIISDSNEIIQGEILCTNLVEGITCEMCKKCNGNTGGYMNIADVVHGLEWKVQKFTEYYSVK